MLTADRARELLEYDPETGVFRWRVSRGGRRAGSVAGHRQAFVRKQGTTYYWVIRVEHRLHLAHRVAFLIMTGRWPADEIDHSNGASEDNTWLNLREASGSQNMQNKRRASSNKVGLKGVSWDKFTGRWVARIRIPSGKYANLGRFNTAEEAHEAYIAAANLHFEEFARAA